MNSPVAIDDKGAIPASGQSAPDTGRTGAANTAPRTAPLTPAEAKKVEKYMNVADLRAAAKRRLPRCVFEFVDKGSEDQLSLDGNREAFRRIKLRNKVMVDLTSRSTAATILGKPATMPFIVAPTGVAGVCWYEGEIALARAAVRMGVPFTLATPSVTSIEKVARVEGGRKWFQLYMWRDRESSYGLVRRAQDAGYETLMLTADTAVPPIREYNAKNGFSMPFRMNPVAFADIMMHPRWLYEVIWRYKRSSEMPYLVHYPRNRPDGIASGKTPLQAQGQTARSVVPNLRGDDLTWEDIARLRDVWKGPILLKGIHLPEDAERAVKEGVDGVIVSNHGGRNLDSAVAPIDVLPEIVAKVKGKTAIFLDSGIRRGNEIVKALALGADAVLAGRPTLYGTAAAGEAGAYHALDLLRKEMETTMGFTGCRSVDEISARTVWLPR